MENSITKIKNVFKKPTNKTSTNTSINPHKHWIVLLWTILVVIICLVLFSLYLLYEIKSEQIFQVTHTSKQTGTLLNQNLLDKVTQSFNQKAQRESNIKSNPPAYQDPSL